MYIIVGLGNPTMKYSGTKHNVGFDTIDKIAKTYKIKVNEAKHKAMIGKGSIAGQKVMLVKPITFMNLSGEAVRAVVDYYKADSKKDVIIIYDDVSLDIGRLRIRPKGSAGGHNGIKSIISHLGHEEFNRIRIGIGEKKGDDMVNHVLGHFNRGERKLVDEGIDRAVEAVETIITEGMDAAMNKYNG